MDLEYIELVWRLRYGGRTPARKAPMSARRALVVLTALALAGCTGGSPTAAPSPSPSRPPPPLTSVVPFSHIVPEPVSAHQDKARQFRFTGGTVIHVSDGAAAPGRLLAGILRPSTGYPLPVRQTGGPAGAGVPDGVSLLLSGAPASVGDQGYTLESSTWTLVIRARTVAGLYNGVQTLHQLLPAEADAATRRSGPWAVAGGQVTDTPR